LTHEILPLQTDYPHLDSNGHALKPTPESPNVHTFVDFRSEMLLPQAPQRYYEPYSFCNRLVLPLRMVLIRRQLERQVAEGLTACREDILSRFSRLDTMDLGALDAMKTQLLISWAFDIDLQQYEWDALFYHLAGPCSALARRDVILAWLDPILSPCQERPNPLLDCWHRTTNSFNEAATHLTSSRFIFDYNGPFIRCWHVVKTFVALYIFLSVPYQVRLQDSAIFL